jgi:hypothetical protein
MANRRPPQTSLPIRRRIELFERVYADLKGNPYGQAADIAITYSLYSDHTEVSTNIDDEHVWVSYLTSLRQMISPDDHVCLGHMLRELPRHIDDIDLRLRLREARRAWKAAQGVQSQVEPLAALTDFLLAPWVLADFTAGRDLARLYLYGRIFHNDPELSDKWESLPPNYKTFVKHQFRIFDSKVREVIIEVRKVIKEAEDKNVLSDDPLDLRAA